MKLLTATDGTLISLAHVATVSYGMDHEGYRKAALDHHKYEWEMRKAEGDPELVEALKDQIAAVYPQGAPQAADFYRTKVGCTDGRRYWVKEAFEDVRLALLDA